MSQETAPIGDRIVSLEAVRAERSRHSVTALDRIELSSLPSLPSRWPILAALLLSVLLHGAMLYRLVSLDAPSAVGGGGQELEAIGVELVPASVLESVVSHDVPDEGAASISPEIGAPDPAAANRTTPEPAKQDTSSKISPLADQSQIDREPETKTEDTETDKQKEEKTSSEAVVAGGAASRAADESQGAVASAGATAGQLSRYAIEVRAALGRGRPRHTGTRGRAVVAFGVTEAGSIRFAEIVKSSGKDRIDDAALATVRNARFPTPPAGMTDAQRSYIVPFEFR